MSIANNIKLLREWSGLSQEQLAIIAGVSDKAVSTWETGKNEPRMGAIQKIADHFSLRKSDIIEDGGMATVIKRSNSTNTPASAHMPVDEQLAELISCYHFLDKPGKDALLAAAQGMRNACEAKSKNEQGAG